ncbi:MAG: protein kinase [Alphaproteobacteria bacterium]|nr:protein kinase [Alphaproteobacteria bacterium]
MEHGKLGKYEISGILGKGAMGTVYDAHDPVIDRRVAIKTLALPDATDTEAQQELARFKREAQAAGRLTHPNIIGVFDYGETAKLAYIVMEYVDGPSLKSLLDKNERFPPTETVRIIEELLTGLQFSHDRGVVHRDIKPGNVMLTRDGQVKIADFGIARMESSSMTQAGTIMGTPAYMSPEQFMGQTVDSRSDIYSVGVLLYQMLTGERPFEGSMTAIMHKVLNVSPPHPSELSVTAPETLDSVVARAMAKRPSQRYASANEFARSLRAAFQGHVLAPEIIDTEATIVAAPSKIVVPSSAPFIQATVAQPLPSPPALPPEKRSIVPLVAGLALLATGLGGGGWYWLGQRHSQPSAIIATTPASVPGASVLSSTSPMQNNAVSVPSSDTGQRPMLGALPAPTDSPAPAKPSNSIPEPAPSTVEVSPSPTPDAPGGVERAAIQPSQPPAAPISEITAAVPRPSPATLRAALQTAVAKTHCALLHGKISDDGSVTVTGLVSQSRNAELQQRMNDVASIAPTAWQVRPFEGPYCDAIDTIRLAERPFGTGIPDIGLGVKTDQVKLHENDNIVPGFTMPDYPGYVQLSYISNDGALVHLYPSNEARQADVMIGELLQSHKINGMESRQFPAGATVYVGDPATCQCKPEEIGWQVAPPYGADMMIIAISSQPLFPKPRPSDDTAETYLRDLQAALTDAIRRGLRVDTRAILVETELR